MCRKCKSLVSQKIMPMQTGNETIRSHVLLGRVPYASFSVIFIREGGISYATFSFILMSTFFSLVFDDASFPAMVITEMGLP